MAHFGGPFLFVPAMGYDLRGPSCSRPVLHSERTLAASALHFGGDFPTHSLFLEEHTMIKVGDTLPATTLMEFSEVEGNGCSIGPNPVDVAKATAGKTIALFALPGAFTPTCSAKHVPGLCREIRRAQGRGRR
jgi:hypothetical protein